MKKIALSLAGVLAATAFAPEASAIPAFARQVGMACQACHFQHFPLLNSFGRAFKASGFTMMGAQGKVEGEHLSIPNVLNISALTTAGYESISNTPAPGKNGSWLLPNGGGELSLFFGGRVAENIGFLSEFAMPDNAPAASSAKMSFIYDVGSAKAGLVLVANNAPAYSMELLNTGAVSTHRLMGRTGGGAPFGSGSHINVTSAAQYLGTKAGGHGVSAVVSGDMGFVNIGRYGIGAIGGASTPTLSTTYARGAYIFNAGGWDSAVGIQAFSGHDSVVGVANMDTKATIIDGQMQGEAGGMPLGIYASYGRAPTSVLGNQYNPFAALVGAADRKSFNIAAELGVIPHKATVQLALRSGKDGSGTLNVAAGQGDKDNAIMIAGTYELAQNVELSLTHTANSGSAWNTPVGGVAPIGKNVTTLLVEALF